MRRGSKDPRRRSKLPRKRSVTKGGRGSDRPKIAWAHGRPCFVAGKRQDSPCGGGITVHHDRRLGAPANDLRVVVACQAHHQHDYGPHSIERLGRQGFQEFFSIDMDDETAHLEMLWVAHKQHGSFDE